MAIYFRANNPKELLDSFKKAIDDGVVATWFYDKDGDFTHSTEQWKNLAWLRPRVENDNLIFSIINPKGQTISTIIYAIYHGRFIESMLSHCDSQFINVEATSMPSDKDSVS